eukprot:scaffold74453_cov50-Phaeocystis_antarctica.AAC.3
MCITWSAALCCGTRSCCRKSLTLFLSRSPVGDRAAPRARDSRQRASTGREVFIAPLAAHGKLQVPSCHPYEVRARGSERSRRVRFGTGPGSLEKVA